MSEQKHTDYAGKPKYQKKQAARRAKANITGDTPYQRGANYETVARPNGVEWENRRRRCLDKGHPCLYCGRPPQRAVVAHLVSLSEGQHLGISTGDLRHPLNSEANLVAACAKCNLWAGSASIWTGRAKVADKLGMSQPYNGPVPDTTAVKAALDELRALKVPGQPTELTAPSTWPYRTIQEAMDDLDNGDGTFAPGDLADMWAHSGEMDCKCGPADLTTCYLCLPPCWVIPGT